MIMPFPIAVIVISYTIFSEERFFEQTKMNLNELQVFKV